MANVRVTVTAALYVRRRPDSRWIAQLPVPVQVDRCSCDRAGRWRRTKRHDPSSRWRRREVRIAQGLVGERIESDALVELRHRNLQRRRERDRGRVRLVASERRLRHRVVAGGSPDGGGKIALPR